MITFHHEDTKKTHEGHELSLYERYFVAFVIPPCLREEVSRAYGLR
jgi:hypothetical protein